MKRRLWKPTRRLFLAGGVGLIAAPAIVRAASFLPLVKPGIGVSFALDWAGHLEDSTGGTTITFSAVPIGAADSNRIVGVGVWWRSAADSDVISSMTVGGISASQASGAYSTRSDGGACLSDIWYAAVPTGTTANVVVNFSGSAARAGVSTYRIITSTPTPSDTDFGISAGVAAATTGSITVPGGGAGFAMFGSRNFETSGPTWTNATMDYHANTADLNASVSSAKFTASNAITCTAEATSPGEAISAATWN